MADIASIDTREYEAQFGDYVELLKPRVMRLVVFTALVGMLAINKLPRFHHPVFYSERFARATDDGFFVSVEAADAQFKKEDTAEFLKSIGGREVELLVAND